MRLLLVEDDVMVGKSLQRGLLQAGFSVDWVRDGRQAELALGHRLHDLAILDLGLPQVDGMQLLKTLRDRGDGMPVLIASARDTVRDKIAGLEAGADDYVLKPFDLDELIARVRALLRRHAGSGSPLLRCGALVLDPAKRVVSLDGHPIELSAREFGLLEALMLRPGTVISKEKLEESLYGWGEEIASNAVEVHVHNLRRKLGAERIRNVRGVGYRVSEV
ncbi:MAG: response regulator [Roseateles sp.]|jgi:two-component system response regulator QseB|uniref:Two-component system response regulator QseB n=1 Tax=Roseateles asaccharophilus TaxID=582607 RepID=A0ABU2AG73_9BURK|nr:response regulator [Roseateles asaccharophilus]MDR7336179.1 two-component system response regulator QseB [Roseateles asaccharophilus]